MNASMAPTIRPFTQAHRQALLKQLSREYNVRALKAAVARHGMCRRQDTERWFAPHMTVPKARALCAGCPVQASCLQLAIAEDAAYTVATREPITNGDNIPLFGVRGGLPAHSRREPAVALLRRLGWARPVEEATA